MDQGYQFYLTYRNFVGENLRHLHEEETVIMPELHRLYTDEKLRQVEPRTYQKMTPEQMIHLLTTLFPHFNFDDKQQFLRDIKDFQSDKFKQIWPHIVPYVEESEKKHSSIHWLFEISRLA